MLKTVQVVYDNNSINMLYWFIDCRFWVIVGEEGSYCNHRMLPALAA